MATLLAFVERLHEKHPAAFLSRLRNNLSSLLLDKDSGNDSSGSDGHSNENGQSSGNNGQETGSGTDDAEPNGG
ncbi:MAG: hypothetical protein MJE77_41970 [Proteobacteria bacterium]|nr:hypothetical protein [Pseudomonadota bacterium]